MAKPSLRVGLWVAHVAWFCTCLPTLALPLLLLLLLPVALLLPHFLQRWAPTRTAWESGTCCAAFDRRVDIAIYLRIEVQNGYFCELVDFERVKDCDINASDAGHIQVSTAKALRNRGPPPGWHPPAGKIHGVPMINLC